MVDCFLAQSEHFLQHHVTDPRPEQRCCLCLHARILAVQGRDAYGLAFAHVELEVQKTSGEHKHIALVYGCGKQLVVGAHEPHQQRTLQHEQALGGAGVRVGWDKAALTEVETCHGAV